MLENRDLSWAIPALLMCYHGLFMRESSKNAGTRRFAAYAWFVLAYNVGVILWGTVVRATGSGAGCGDHWPLCGGQVIPHAAQIATLIEFAHRASSGIAVALVLVLAYFAFRRFAAKHPSRRYAAAAVFFTFTEGLLGAALVLFGDVGNNASASRVFILSLHLVNTFLLLASLALTAKSAGSGQQASAGDGAVRGVNPWRAPTRGIYMAYVAGLLGALAIAVTGTIAALGDTLFHATSFAQGFEWDLSPTASPLLRLRIIHPVVAVLIGTYLIALAVHALSTPTPRTAKRMAASLLVLIVIQFGFGTLNVLLLAPLWMQVLHLLTADLIWITLVLLSAAMLGRVHVSLVEYRAPAPVPEAEDRASALTT